MDSRELKAARVKRGMSQQSVAARIGASTASYSNKENGKTNMSVKEANEIARSLGLSREEIMAIFLANNFT